MTKRDNKQDKITYYQKHKNKYILSRFLCSISSNCDFCLEEKNVSSIHKVINNKIIIENKRFLICNDCGMELFFEDRLLPNSHLYKLKRINKEQ